jgi:Zn-finger nucleic acid-binding protein
VDGTLPPMKRACPKCEAELTPLQRGAFKCPNCAGMFVPPAALPSLSAEDDDDAAAESHDADGGRCPADRTIMSRAEIADDVHLERCSSCRGVWFDAGEWSRLAERQLLDHLDEFWTAEWRASRRRSRNAESADRRLRETFGEELYTSLHAMAARLKGHERRSQALAFLREASEQGVES